MVNSNVKKNIQDQLVFEYKSSPFLWLIPALFAAMMFFGSYSCTLSTTRDVAICVGGVFAGFAGLYVTVIAFIRRSDHCRIYVDRVERYRGGRLIESLLFKDARYVAYGFRGDYDHLLSFSGKGKKPKFAFNQKGRHEPKDPRALTQQKLLCLRDELYLIVCDYLVSEANGDEGVEWVGKIRIKHQGLLIAGELIPWSMVNISANYSNGQVVVKRVNKVLKRMIMIDDNVVAGLMAIDKIKGEK